MKLLYVLILLFSIILSLSLPPSADARRADISSYKVVVSTRTIERGQVISSSDVDIVETNRRDPRALSDLNSVVGKLLKRTIGRNTAIKRDYLMDSSNTLRSVQRGRDVLIVVQINGMKVSANGRLLKSAKVGEMVEIENLSSGKIIFGRLIDSKTVAVNFQ